jgi:hypothetical protein
MADACFRFTTILAHVRCTARRDTWCEHGASVLFLLGNVVKWETRVLSL